MTLQRFLVTWSGTQMENRFSRIVIGVQLAVILLLGVVLTAKNHTVVMVPPNLGEAATISANSASPESKVAWGMHLASMLGNVNPRTVTFLTESVSPTLSARMYRPFMEALETQAAQIKDERLTVSFAINGARYDHQRDRVFVTGVLTTEGLRGDRHTEERTYELGFVVKNYRVLLDDFQVHTGPFRRIASSP